MKINTSIVSYSNAKPFIYGLEKDTALAEQMNLTMDVPAQTADKLLNNEVDLALVPVAILTELDDFRLISDFCIGATDEVYSVALFSNHPIEQIECVLLDGASRTSNLLCKVLFEEHWKMSVEFYEDEAAIPTNANVGRIIIGDRAFGLENQYKFKYDLSSTWYAMTGKPFVFATWVSRVDLPDTFIDAFNNALMNGLENRDEVIQSLTSDKKKQQFYAKYLYDYIEYDLSYSKRKGLATFLDMISVGV